MESTIKDISFIEEKEIIEEVNIRHKDIEKYIERKGYLINNKLIVNSDKGNLLNQLKKSLLECKRFYFTVAFINFSGLQLLLDTFKELEDKGVKGKILTSTYLNFTEPKALERIKNFNNIDLKVFVANNDVGFHTKAYIFENENDYKIIIGSSNITQSALKSNVEWNVKVVLKGENNFVKDVLSEYENLWNKTDFVDEKFLDEYSQFIKSIKNIEKDKKLIFEDYKLLKPNLMQKTALDNLSRLRELGENKALVIAATGTGKTYMSAFDVMNVKPKKMLFIVHREDILKGAEKSFKRLCGNKDKKTGFLTGNQKDFDAEYLFSTIQCINNNLHEFKEDEFEYIIIDEAHHGSSPSYKKVMDYFKPKFLLGMTATPERCDGDDIFQIFNNNVALEIRLHEALEMNLVVPFHYFGITDIEAVDLSGINIDDIDKVSKILKVNERVDFIIEKMKFYGFDGEKRKAIGFCVSIDHAKYMAEQFNKRGIKSIALTGENSPVEREKYIKKLEDEKDELEVIFTVDIFNEGVDIPSINLVLMLRPTNSPIIFIQQLGRGLRSYPNKSFLTVLDFIGNHNKAFLIAMALNGGKYYDKDTLKVSVATEFANIPGCTNIQMDRIAQERIIEQLNSENFNSMKYLREEYLQFKNMKGGNIPYFLCDYLKYDGVIDPIKFIKKEKTYLNFLSKIEKEESLKELFLNDKFLKILKELSKQLPIKRVYEFVIIKYLLNHENINFQQCKNEILKYIEKIDDNSVYHSIKTLNNQYYDSSQIKNNIKSFNYDNGILNITEDFKEIISEQKYKRYIEDVINYGILRYKKDFGNEYYGIPFLKLYQQYEMVEVALLSNYEKIHSSFRGSGLLSNKNDYFLFIDLHKDADIKESINYEDKFIDEKTFQWQSPNNTAQNSVRGKNIIFNRDRNINLHLFVRKYKEIDKSVQPYIYIGKGNTIEYNGEKPITVTLELEHEVPSALYIEFNKKV